MVVEGIKTNYIKHQTKTETWSILVLKKRKFDLGHVFRKIE